MPTAGPYAIPTPPIVIPNDRTTAKGTKIYYQLLGGTNWELLAGVVGISGPEMSREVIDTTELDQVPSSTNAGESDEMYYWKGQHPGTKEGAAVSLTMNMNSYQFQTLTDLYQRDAICNFQIRFKPRGSETGPGMLSFTGFVESIGHDAEDGQLIKTPVKLRPSSRVLYTLPTGDTTTAFP